jgi:hypothetical protein
MPWNIARSAQFYDKEVLKYAQDPGVTKHVVLDANFFTQATGADARTVVPAGTILKLSVTNTKQMVEYTGTGTIECILGRPVDLLAQSTSADEPAPGFYLGCVFATASIVGFTAYSSQLASALSTCKFE